MATGSPLPLLREPGVNCLRCMPVKDCDDVKSGEMNWQVTSSYLPRSVTNEWPGRGTSTPTARTLWLSRPRLLPSVDDYCLVSAENVWHFILPHHLNKHGAITERYLATGVERCICMKESVYTLGQANNCLLFAKLWEVPMFQGRQNRYIDLGCIFGRKLLKIENIKKIGTQNITTSFYNWCDFSLNEQSWSFPR